MGHTKKIKLAIGGGQVEVRQFGPRYHFQTAIPNKQFEIKPYDVYISRVYPVLFTEGQLIQRHSFKWVIETNKLLRSTVQANGVLHVSF